VILRLRRPDVPTRVALQRVHYTLFRDPNTGEESYTRRLTGNFYPRFHMYVDEHATELVLKLHLDQKKPSYAGSRKHNGEYDGPTIEAELQRIYEVLG
jgi:hypothetical protein